MYDLIIILTIIMFIFVGYSWIKSRTSPVVSVRALVLRNRVSSPSVYFITFGTPDGERELVVRESDYFVYEQGQWGYLTYQGEIFRGFVCDPPAEIEQPTGPPKPPLQPLDPEYHDR